MTLLFNLINKLQGKFYFYLSRAIYCSEERFLNKIYKIYILNNRRTKKILQTIIDSEKKQVKRERSLPSEECFQQNGWWKMMFLRYGLAIFYSFNKTVLDTCSGLGWGAYMVDAVAKIIHCIELDRDSICFSKKTWPSKNAQYINGTVLHMPFKDSTFNVALAMETIEHFNPKDQRQYLKELYRVLKKRGLLLGSSSFPETAKLAKIISRKNPYHLHVCTEQEIEMLLIRTGFKKAKVFQNRLFFMAKK